MSTFYMVVADADFNVHVLELLAAPEEHTDYPVFDSNWATYNISHFIVRRIYDYHTNDETNHIEIKQLVYYKEADWDGCISHQNHVARCRINVNRLPIEQLQHQHYCAITNRLITDAEKNGWGCDKFKYRVEPFKCFRAKEAAINHFNCIHGFPYTTVSNGGRINHIDCCCLEIPTQCTIQ